MVLSTWSGPCGLSSTRMAVTHIGGRPLEGESWWMVGPAASGSSPMRNVQPSTNLYCRQQAPPMRRYVNDGATQTLAAPTIVDARVDPTKLRISRESNMLGSTMPFRDPVKRRTSRVDDLLFKGERLSPGNSRTHATKGIDSPSAFTRHAEVGRFGTSVPTQFGLQRDGW